MVGCVSSVGGASKEVISESRWGFLRENMVSVVIERMYTRYKVSDSDLR